MMRLQISAFQRRIRCGLPFACPLSACPLSACLVSVACLMSSLLFLAKPAAAEPWQTVASDQGVVVEEQRIPGRSLPIFRGTTEIDAPAELLIAIIRDVPDHTLWMPNCAESRVIADTAHSDPDTQLVYRRTEAPWPVADRDVVLESRIDVADAKGEIRVSFESVDIPSVPAASGAIRMPHVSGFYLLRSLESGGTRVLYQVDADPGGNLPTWLASRTSRDNPILTLVGLREQAALERQAPARALD